MLRNKIKEIEEISKELNEIYDEMVERFVGELDELMNEIRENAFQDVTLATMSNYYLELTDKLYFVGARAKKLENDRKTSKIRKQEVFNQAAIRIRQQSILNAVKPSDKKTQTDIAAEANEIAKEDNLTYELYDSVITTIESRLKDGWNMVGTLKHRCNVLIQEEQSNSIRSNYKRNMAE